MPFDGDFCVDDVLDDPVGALRWAQASWDSINFTQSNQANYDLYHCRDKEFEATMEEFQPKTVFPLPKIFVDKIAASATLPYLQPGAFVGVPISSDLFPGLGLNQDELNSAAWGIAALIEQDLSAHAGGSINFPLWAKNASLAGTAMLTAHWKTETRMLPVRNGTEKRRTVELPDGSHKSILFPELKSHIVRESLEIQALPPGTWGVDPEAEATQDACWGFYEEYVPMSIIEQAVRDKYFDLVSIKDVEDMGTMSSYRNMNDDRILYLKHFFAEEDNQNYFGQAPNEPRDRVRLLHFYTKELRIYSMNGMLLKIEPNPYSLFSDGFPFEILTFNGTGGIIGVSDLYFLKPYFFEYNKLRNSELYNAEMSSDQSWVTTLNDADTINKFKYRQPGSIIYHPHGEQAFIPIPFNPLDPEVKRTREGILQDLMLVAGLNETGLGATPQPNIRSSKQMASLLQQQASRMDAGNMIVGDRMRSLGRKFLEMYRNLMTSDKVVRTFGQGKSQFFNLSPDMLGAVHDIDIRPAFENEALKAMRGDAIGKILPLMAQIPGFDVVELARDILRDMGLDSDKYIKPGMPPAIPPNNGNPPAVGPVGTAQSPTGMPPQPSSPDTPH